MFKQGKELMGKKPVTLITDGLPTYRDAFDKEYFSLKRPRPKHVYTIRITGDMNNNKMERLNGEVREREKVMRGINKKETPILKGY
jgi:transposase-like protein